MKNLTHSFFFLLLLLLLLLPLSAVSAKCTCETEDQDSDKPKALRYKIAAICSILAASALGVSLPILGDRIPALSSEKDIFFIIKAFAAGVILATGFVHVLPDAFDRLSNPCLGENPWGNFPFPGFTAMVAAILTMMIDSFANSFYKRAHFRKAAPVTGDEEVGGEHEGHVHVHTHGSHGHAHGGSGFVVEDSAAGSADLLRHRIISQVLELGIVIHSIIIGVSLGASVSPKTVRPLVAALTFHQFFEGMGLGGCISQAKFKSRAVLFMVVFFTLTTPLGIGVGIGLSNSYNENSSKALIVEGMLNSASAGILIYMALVDLLAADFMNPRMQSSPKLQLGANASLLFGAACMSLLAKWA